MAYTTITVSNGVEIKKAPIGFSWTTFFFGGWPALFRQDWAWGFGLMLACLFTWGLAGCIVAFFYNKTYLARLLKDGYHVHAMPSNVTEEELKNYLGFITLPIAK